MAEKEYIEREAARAQLIINDELHAADLIKSIQATDVRPVVHGKWEIHRVGWDLLQCTVCKAIQNCNDDGEYYMRHWNYCPNCGADMRD